MGFASHSVRTGINRNKKGSQSVSTYTSIWTRVLLLIPKFMKGLVMRLNSHLASALAALLLSGAALADRPVIDVGHPFPDIAFPSAEDGTPMYIASFRGQKVILHIFASW